MAPTGNRLGRVVGRPKPRGVDLGVGTRLRRRTPRADSIVGSGRGFLGASGLGPCSCQSARSSMQCCTLGQASGSRMCSSACGGDQAGSPKALPRKGQPRLLVLWLPPPRPVSTYPKRQRTFPQISTREFLGESAGRPRRRPPPAGVRAGDVGRRGASGGGRIRGQRDRARTWAVRCPAGEHARRQIQRRPLTRDVGGQGPRLEIVGCLGPWACRGRERRVPRRPRHQRPVHPPPHPRARLVPAGRY